MIIIKKEKGLFVFKNSQNKAKKKCLNRLKNTSFYLKKKDKKKDK